MNNRKIIIYWNGGGRLGNQLITHAHLLAFILEYPNQFLLINTKFWYFNDLFPFSHIYPKPNAVYLKTLDFLLKICQLFPRKIFRFFTDIIKMISFKRSNINIIKIKNDNDSIKLTPKIFESDNTFLEGFRFRNWNLLHKHKSQILAKIQPNQKFKLISTNFINKLHLKSNFIIGVYIRQQDYKVWLNGKYHFELTTYIKWINECEKVFESENPLFIIVGDDAEVCIQVKNEVKNVAISNGDPLGKENYVVNMINLSKCNLIITPPSTFSGWASFMNNTPMIILKSENQIIQKEDIVYNSIFDLHAFDEFTDEVFQSQKTTLML
ncbi:MAG: alpha-1,2-fucosyltransferase [Bacteroidota bacterium]|nr:alpha-1,2-fucosyltransferase [Bacteroidota bacterium]